MNKTTLMTMALLLGASPLSLAGQSPDTAKSPETTPAFNACEWAKNSMKLFNAKREGADNPWIQEFNVKFRAQYQISILDPAGGSDRIKSDAGGKNRAYNDEWRRFRLGAEAKVLRHFTLFANFNIGGLESYEKVTDGIWQPSQTEGVLDELFIRGTFEPVSFTLGKHKPAFIGEYRTSSSKINTIERSALVNQLTAEKTWGLSFKNADAKARFGWEAGVWLNGLHDGTWAEPVFDAADNAMVGLSLNYGLEKHGRLYLDYMHSCVREGRELIGYEGPGARDVLALTWQAKYGRFHIMTEAMAGFNVIDSTDKREGSENVYGLTIMPSYFITDNLEAVFRYQVASGSNAIESDKRYYATNGAFSQVSDLLQGLYFGLNYYVCAANPDTMKIMLGAEYLNSAGRDAHGNKGYTGWSFTSAVRMNF